MQTHRTGLDLLHLLSTMSFSTLFIGQCFSQLAVAVMTVFLTFIISMIGYYVLIRFAPFS